MRDQRGPGRKHWPPHCECGRARVEVGVQYGGCRFCNAIDGTGRSQRQLINILRSIDVPVTQDTIGVEMNLNEKSVARLVSRMTRDGRIAKRPAEAYWGTTVEYFIPRQR